MRRARNSQVTCPEAGPEFMVDYVVSLPFVAVAGYNHELLKNRGWICLILKALTLQFNYRTVGLSITA